MTARLLAIAGVCMLLFSVLGWWVTHHPLAPLDLASRAMRGSNVPLAIALTTSGYGIALTVLAAATIVGAVVLRLPPTIPLAIVISQVVSQGVVNVIKGFFARPRPAAWLYRPEPGYSYPSGHATTAVVFYGAWLVVLWLSPLPLPIRVCGVLVMGVWLLGIGWSRVALGAHYPTDVAGGFLFGIGWLCLTIAFGASRIAGAVSPRL